MKNLKDEKTKIYPSTTRGGKELPSSSGLDSPSVLSKLATPKPASSIDSDMSHIIDDATSSMHDTYDENTSMPDTTMRLSDFLDEGLEKLKILNLMILMKVIMKALLINMNCLRYRKVML